MMRTLVLIAVAGFVVCVGCLAAATALGGREALHGPWGRGWDIDWDDGHVSSWPSGDGGPTGSREIAWSGADALDLDLPADVTFTQSPGPGRLTITGPQGALDRVELDGPHLRYRDDGFNFGRLTVVMTAPDVRSFAIDGDGRIAINGYDEDDLSLDVSGHGDVSGAGRAKNVKVDISGDGDVDLSGLKSDSADADISGSGRARLAPANAADLRISGDGEIDLLTRPPNLVSDVSGSGRIVEGQTTSQSD